MSKLTVEDVRTIRATFKPGKGQGSASARALGRRFNISDVNVYDIVRRLTWKHVT